MTPAYVPYSSRRFDPVEYAKAQKRPEPVAPVLLTREDIQPQKGWTDQHGTRRFRLVVFRRRAPTLRHTPWFPEDVQKCEEALAALQVGP
jgi:hypothetical protein